jgi:hypothetical protein
VGGPGLLTNPYESVKVEWGEDVESGGVRVCMCAARQRRSCPHVLQAEGTSRFTCVVLMTRQSYFISLLPLPAAPRASGRRAGLPDELHPKFELAESMAAPNLSSNPSEV